MWQASVFVPLYFTFEHHIREEFFSTSTSVARCMADVRGYDTPCLERMAALTSRFSLVVARLLLVPLVAFVLLLVEPLLWLHGGLRQDEL